MKRDDLASLLSQGDNTERLLVQVYWSDDPLIIQADGYGLVAEERRLGRPTALMAIDFLNTRVAYSNLGLEHNESTPHGYKLPRPSQRTETGWSWTPEVVAAGRRNCPGFMP